MATLIINGIELDDFYNKVGQIVAETLQSQKEVKPEPINKYLTRVEVAKKLNLSLPTLNDYTKRSIIPAYRIGNRVLYKEIEVENALRRIVTSKNKKGQRYE